jgi:hypothetical protein
MSTNLSKAEIALMEKLGLTSESLVVAQAAAERKRKADGKAAYTATVKAALEPAVQTLIDAGIPSEQSAKSAWVGASVSFDVAGYGVKVTFTDKAATAARESK